MSAPHDAPSQHAQLLLDLLLTLLTSNTSTGTFTRNLSILQSLKKPSNLNSSRVMADEDDLIDAVTAAAAAAARSNDTSLDLTDAFANGSSGNASTLALGGDKDPNIYHGRGKINLTLLKLDLDLSKVFPSLEAVSEDVQVFLIFVYSLAAVLSLVGNVTVILVLAFGRRSSVRCYLINLAVSGITMATFCIPFSYTSFMFHRWVFAPEFCRIVAFMQHVSVTCSVYTLVAIGVDRYKALIHPLNTRWTKSRARLVIGGIWVFSVVISLVPLVVSDSERYDWDGEWYYECKENWPKTQNELYEKTYTVALFVLTFALPVVGLGYTYLSIVGMMCSYRIPGNAEPSRDQQHLQAKVKVINMMIAVMVCFVLSWFPLQVLQFLIYFAPEITQCRGHECFTYYMSFFTCHWIAMANSFMNPFIYCFMSNNFREDLCQFIRKCGRKRMRRQRSNPWSRSELGSSFRSILYITHKTSVQSSSKMSFRAKCEKQREGDTLELRPLHDVQSTLRSSPTPALAATSTRKGKLAVATLCLQEVPPSIYLNQQNQLQHLNNHPVNHRNSSCRQNNHNNQKSRKSHRYHRHHHSGSPGSQLRSGCSGVSRGHQEKAPLSSAAQLQDERELTRKFSSSTALGSSNSLLEDGENYGLGVGSGRTNEGEKCRGGSVAGCSLVRCQSEGCVSGEEEQCQHIDHTASLNDIERCPLTLENGVYECIDLVASKRSPHWNDVPRGARGAHEGAEGK